MLSLVLVVTAFEWKTPYVVFEDGPIDINTTAGPPIDLVVKPMPTPPRENSGEIVPIPGDPPIPVEPIDLEPPVIDEPISNPGTEPIVIPGLGDPIDVPAPVANITRAAVPSDGYEAFYAHIYKNLSIPDHLIRQGFGGKIHVSFVVDTNGKLTDIEIIKGFDKQLEKQIIKILQESPEWEAAWSEGRKVKTRMQLPVVIKIDN